MGIFTDDVPNDIYADALKRVDEAVQNQQMQIDTKTYKEPVEQHEDDMDEYADNLMNDLECEFV